MHQQFLIPFEFEEKSRESIRTLLDLLNDNNKQIYQLVFDIEINKLLIACASNKENIVFNIVDINGNTPSGFSACWRSYLHIKHELKHEYGNQTIQRIEKLITKIG